MIRKAASCIAGFLCVKLAVLTLGLFLSHPVQTPSAETQALQERNRQEQLVQAGEEEQRQREYAAHPGAPYPTADWQP